MSKNFISDDDIEKALDYLRDSAITAAQARANRIYMEEYRKSLKSKMMQRFAMSPLGAQERDAYASREYQIHLDALKTAVEEDEKHRFLREAAQAKIEAWRSMSANNRVNI